MNVRVFVAGETDIAELARIASLEESFHGAPGSEDAVSVFEADDFMMLKQIHVIDAEPLEGLIDLTGGLPFLFCHLPSRSLAKTLSR